ncbi:unnamed protein product [Caenorhabditis angaria]|uniref:ShKT domain-containing protein n=1 Tax=Caenorhabditis angaria TaxID=860376 RepID=A0A9P1N0L7_9PELO|nr:unnamed protein product [Caenorhabditis angaria]
MQIFVFFALLVLGLAYDSTTTVDPFRTTGTTTATYCHDEAGIDCQQYIGQCYDPKYIPLLEGKCDKTCGYCGPIISTPSPASCVDNSQNCVIWVKNGFCTNTMYSCAQRKQYCAKSCNMCYYNC